MWRSPASFMILQQLEGVAATAKSEASLQQMRKIKEKTTVLASSVNLIIEYLFSGLHLMSRGLF